ncbi:MAG TPA: ABC transporter permease [Tepidisphaeraceae bacterium]|jgi:phospholipid/cholesterol/gamma-HCH transport system permease protein|nr:ABC transporter permease [Tepidisphaeraceae bacterium]
MPLRVVERVGGRTTELLDNFGDFCIFVGHTFAWLLGGLFNVKHWRLLLPQFYEVGVRSVPVVGVVGAFIGMVMAVETYATFAAIGQESRVGSVINVSVVKQIGPVLAAVMLAGRVGGALAAELGTMRVTEQIDALRVMGSDPIRYLVVPRFIACVLLTPILTAYSDVLGILGGWVIAVFSLHVPNQAYWYYSTHGGVGTWQIMEGICKAFLFGGAIALISCYKGFNSGSGASGVGRACTEGFVASFIAIIILNFIFAEASQQMYQAIYGLKSIFG